MEPLEKEIVKKEPTIVPVYNNDSFPSISEPKKFYFEDFASYNTETVLNSGQHVKYNPDGPKFVIVGYNYDGSCVKDGSLSGKIYPKVVINPQRKHLKEIGFDKARNGGTIGHYQSQYLFFNDVFDRNPISHDTKLFVICSKWDKENRIYYSMEPWELTTVDD